MYFAALLRASLAGCVSRRKKIQQMNFYECEVAELQGTQAQWLKDVYAEGILKKGFITLTTFATACN